MTPWISNSQELETQPWKKVAVEGVTVVKEVHTKEVHKGKQISKCAYVNTLCTNKSLGFTFNTYTPIVIP